MGREAAVHMADLEGRLWVDLTRSPNRRRMTAICALLPLPGHRRKTGEPAAAEVMLGPFSFLFARSSKAPTISPSTVAPHLVSSSVASIRGRWRPDKDPRRCTDRADRSAGRGPRTIGTAERQSRILDRAANPAQTART